MPMNRRAFLEKAGAAAAAGLFPGRVSTAFAPRRLPENMPAALPLLRNNRFLTFNSVIRVNQIEVRRDRNEGVDEVDLHTPEAVRALRTAFGAGFPGGRMTWALSWLAIRDTRPNFKEIRRLVKGFHDEFGDEVTFIPGGYFAPMYNTREEVNRDLHEALGEVAALIGGGYRPRSVLAGFLAADNLRWLADKEDVHVCQGNIWSQYAIDYGDGDGSIAYPYYPSREHFLKPARGAGDFIDCVNLDGWTCDFLAARRAGFAEGFNSRMGVGPIETIRNLGPEKGLAQMLATTAAHFDAGFGLNGFAWVTNCWEVCLVKLFGGLDILTRWLTEIRRRWPETLAPTMADFGSAWRSRFRDNSEIDYRFIQRGSGIGGSDAPSEIRWFMNADFRLALLRNWRAGGPEKVIDFTRYDLPAREPGEMGRNWSLMNRINQKGTRPQDNPVPLSALPAEDRAFIARRHPEILEGIPAPGR
jgi:hypothetical protein